MKNFLKSTNAISIFGLLSLFIFSIILYSCGKESIPKHDKVDQLTGLDITIQEYVYKEVSYFLEFPSNDEDAGALLTDDFNALVQILGNKDYYSMINGDLKVYLYDSEEKFFEAMNYGDDMIETIKSIESGDVENAEVVLPRGRIMDYTEHRGFGGETLCGEDVSGVACRGTGCCSRVFYQQDLSTVPFPGGGTWDNTITSMRINGSLIANPGDEITIMFYREAGFPFAGCKRVGFNLASFPGMTLSSTNLRGIRWCFLGKSLNDRITGWTLVHCPPECDLCWSNPS